MTILSSPSHVPHPPSPSHVPPPSSPSHVPPPSSPSHVPLPSSPSQTDLSHRLIDEAEGKLWAESRGFIYYETSALTNENVIDMFEVNHIHVTMATII